MKKTTLIASCAILAAVFSGSALAGTVTQSFRATGYDSDDGNRLYSSDGSVTGDIGAVQLLVQYDTTALTGCVNTATSSWCKATTAAGSMLASFTTTTYNNGVQTFTVTGGGAALSPVNCPEGFCSDTGGGVHIYDSNGSTAIQFYTFGTNGHYMANLLYTSHAWVNGSVATDANFVNAAIADFSYTNWFYSGQFTSQSGSECGGPGQGPYCGGANFAPGNYYGSFGDLNAFDAAAPEPGSWMSLATGLAGVALLRIRSRRA